MRRSPQLVQAMLAKHVAGSARAARLKEHRSQQREEQLMCGLLREMHRNAVHLPEEERVDGEKSCAEAVFLELLTRKGPLPVETSFLSLFLFLRQLGRGGKA